jgi:hypothetical protein
MKAFGITNGVLSSSPVSKSTVTLNSLGYSPVISANGTSNAIAWVIDASAYQQGANNNSSDTSSGAAVLRAFNATNLSQQLYNSGAKAGDKAPGTVKYPVPAVADGKVFVAGDFGVAVYGIGVIPPAPVIAPGAGTYANSVTVTLTDATNGVTIYYTLDGTTPTTKSLLYTGSFTLTNSAEVNAIAAQEAAFESGVASASFVVAPGVLFTSTSFSTNGAFQLGLSAVPGSNYVLQATTNFATWVSLTTNQASNYFLDLFDPDASNYLLRFYRVLAP